MPAGQNNNNEVARRQVEAFMQMMHETHDLDEEKLKRIIAVAQKNGKAYVTWAWVISLLLVVVGFLAVRNVTSIESGIDSLRYELREVRERQADVRERLRTLEEVVRRHEAGHSERR